MSATSNINGRDVIFDEDQKAWLWADTKEPINTNHIEAREKAVKNLLGKQLDLHAFAERFADFLYENLEEETLMTFRDRLNKRYDV